MFSNNREANRNKNLVWMVTAASLLLCTSVFVYLYSNHCTFGTESSAHLARLQEELKARPKLPSDFQISLYPGAELEQVTEVDVAKGKIERASLVIDRATSVENICDFYRNEFAKCGYKVFDGQIHLPFRIERTDHPGTAIDAIGPQVAAIKQDALMTLSVLKDKSNGRTKFIISKYPTKTPRSQLQ